MWWRIARGRIDRRVRPRGEAAQAIDGEACEGHRRRSTRARCRRAGIRLRRGGRPLRAASTGLPRRPRRYRSAPQNPRQEMARVSARSEARDRQADRGPAAAATRAGRRGSGMPSPSRNRAASSTAMRRVSPAIRSGRIRRVATSSAIAPVTSADGRPGAISASVRSPIASSMSWMPSALFAWYFGSSR